MPAAPAFRSILITTLLASLGITTGCDKVSKTCFEGTTEPIHHQVSACGELCEKDDQKACGRMTELAIPACSQKGDRETCSWMCNYSPTGGKEVFCAELEKLPPPK